MSEKAPACLGVLSSQSQSLSGCEGEGEGGGRVGSSWTPGRLLCWDLLGKTRER